MGASFANVDFGLPGGDRNPDDARSIVTMETGDIPVIRQVYEFAGFNGGFAHNLGLGIRQIVWTLVVRAKSTMEINAIAWDMEQAKLTGGGQLQTTKGRVFERAVLDEVREVEGGGDVIITTGSAPAGWVRQKYILRFSVLSGD